MGNNLSTTRNTKAGSSNNASPRKPKMEVAGFIQDHVASKGKMPSEQDLFVYAEKQLQGARLEDPAKYELLFEAQKTLRASSLAPADHGATLAINTPGENPRTWLVPGTPPRPGDSRSLFCVTDELMGQGLTAHVRSAKTRKSGIDIESVAKIAKPSHFQDLINERNILRDWKKLDNENLIAYHGSHINGEDIYLTQEKCEGTLYDLASLLDRVDLPLSTKKEFVYSAIDQILNGIGALHQAGYSHLDIKPTNIGYTPDGTIKVFDAGSSLKSEILPQWCYRGMIGYAAPELKLRKQGDSLSPFACDAYSLGRTIRMLLAMTLGLEAESSLLYQTAETHLANDNPNSRMQISQFRTHLRDVAGQEGVRLLDRESLCRALMASHLVSGKRT